MKNTLKIPLFIAIFVFSFGLISSIFPQIVEAATPTLSFSQSGTNTVQISVYGDPNHVVNMYYYNIGSLVSNSVGSIGTTNNSGYFSNTLNTGSYNIPAGAAVYVIVNGQQSSTATWPSTIGGSIYLSQTNVLLNQGQSTSVSISGGSSNSYYINSNSNSTVVGASISGSVLTLNALTTGSVTINVCSLGTTTTCVPLTVTVNSSWGGNNSGSIYLNPSSVVVAPGQTQVVYINNYNSGNYFNQSYYISNNPGSQYFSASISGNTVVVYGNNPGSATINICTQYSGVSCASLYVTVSANYFNGNYYNNYNGYNYYNGGYTYSYPTTYTNPINYSYPASTYTTYSGSNYSSGSAVGNSVSGVFLSQVPSTGISFGLKMTLFTLGLLLWSMFAAFMIARKKESSINIQAFKIENMKRKGLL